MDSIRKTVCSTCLATDRRLFEINDELRSLLQGLGVEHSEENKVCFECKAIAKRIDTFKHRATLAQGKLNNVKLSEKEELRDLSTLVTTEVSIISCVEELDGLINCSEKSVVKEVCHVTIHKNTDALTDNSHMSETSHITKHGNSLPGEIVMKVASPDKNIDSIPENSDMDMTDNLVIVHANIESLLEKTDDSPAKTTVNTELLQEKSDMQETSPAKMHGNTESDKVKSDVIVNVNSDSLPEKRALKENVTDKIDEHNSWILEERDLEEDDSDNINENTWLLSEESDMEDDDLDKIHDNVLSFSNENDKKENDLDEIEENTSLLYEKSEMIEADSDKIHKNTWQLSTDSYMEEDDPDRIQDNTCSDSEKNYMKKDDSDKILENSGAHSEKTDMKEDGPDKKQDNTLPLLETSDMQEDDRDHLNTWPLPKKSDVKENSPVKIHEHNIEPKDVNSFKNIDKCDFDELITASLKEWPVEEPVYDKQFITQSSKVNSKILVSLAMDDIATSGKTNQDVVKIQNQKIDSTKHLNTKEGEIYINTNIMHKPSQSARPCDGKIMILKNKCERKRAMEQEIHPSVEKMPEKFKKIANVEETDQLDKISVGNVTLKMIVAKTNIPDSTHTNKDLFIIQMNQNTNRSDCNQEQCGSSKIMKLKAKYVKNLNQKASSKNYDNMELESLLNTYHKESNVENIDQIKHAILENVFEQIESKESKKEKIHEVTSKDITQSSLTSSSNDIVTSNVTPQFDNSIEVIRNPSEKLHEETTYNNSFQNKETYSAKLHVNLENMNKTDIDAKIMMLKNRYSNKLTMEEPQQISVMPQNINSEEFNEEMNDMIQSSEIDKIIAGLDAPNIVDDNYSEDLDNEPEHIDLDAVATNDMNALLCNEVMVNSPYIDNRTEHLMDFSAIQITDIVSLNEKIISETDINGTQDQSTNCHVYKSRVNDVFIIERVTSEPFKNNAQINTTANNSIKILNEIDRSANEKRAQKNNPSQSYENRSDNDSRNIFNNSIEINETIYTTPERPEKGQTVNNVQVRVYSTPAQKKVFKPQNNSSVESFENFLGIIKKKIINEDINKFQFAQMRILKANDKILKKIKNYNVIYNKKDDEIMRARLDSPVDYYNNIISVEHSYAKPSRKRGNKEKSTKEMAIEAGAQKRFKKKCNKNPVERYLNEKGDEMSSLAKSDDFTRSQNVANNTQTLEVSVKFESIDASFEEDWYNDAMDYERDNNAAENPAEAEPVRGYYQYEDDAAYTPYETNYPGNEHDDDYNYQEYVFDTENVSESYTNASEISSNALENYTNATEISSNAPEKYTNISEIMETPNLLVERYSVLVEDISTTSEPKISSINVPASQFDSFEKSVNSKSLIMAKRKKIKRGRKLKVGKHKCFDCTNTFTTTKALQYHYDKYHSEKAGKFVCEICKYRFKMEEAKEFHKLLHYRSFKCRWCAYESLQYSDLREHFQEVHKNSLDPGVKIPQHRKKYSLAFCRYTCDVCSSRWLDKRSLKTHLYEHEKPEHENREEAIQNYAKSSNDKINTSNVTPNFVDSSRMTESPNIGDKLEVGTHCLYAGDANKDVMTNTSYEVNENTVEHDILSSVGDKNHLGGEAHESFKDCVYVQDTNETEKTLSSKISRLESHASRIDARKPSETIPTTNPDVVRVKCRGTDAAKNMYYIEKESKYGTQDLNNKDYQQIFKHFEKVAFDAEQELKSMYYFPKKNDKNRSILKPVVRPIPVKDHTNLLKEGIVFNKDHQKSPKKSYVREHPNSLLRPVLINNTDKMIQKLIIETKQGKIHTEVDYNRDDINYMRNKPNATEMRGQEHQTKLSDIYSKTKNNETDVITSCVGKSKVNNNCMNMTMNKSDVIPSKRLTEVKLDKDFIDKILHEKDTEKKNDGCQRMSLDSGDHLLDFFEAYTEEMHDEHLSNDSNDDSDWRIDNYDKTTEEMQINSAPLDDYDISGSDTMTASEFSDTATASESSCADNPESNFSEDRVVNLNINKESSDEHVSAKSVKKEIKEKSILRRKRSNKPKKNIIYKKIYNTRRRNIKQNMEMNVASVRLVNMVGNRKNISKNHTNISEGHTNITENQTDISKNHTNITENQTDISKIHTNIPEDHTNITENQTDISKNHTNITENQTDISKIHTNILENHTDTPECQVNALENNDEMPENHATASKKQKSRIKPDVQFKNIKNKKIISLMQEMKSSVEFKLAEHKCIDCLLIMNDCSELRKHNESHVKSGYECEICKCRHHTEVLNQTHVQLHYSYFICRYCSKEYINYSSMRQHFQKAHTHLWDSGNATYNLRYACNLCDKTARTRKAMDVHKMIHNGFSCPTCGKSFKKSSSCKTHMTLKRHWGVSLEPVQGVVKAAGGKRKPRVKACLPHTG